KFRKTTNWLRDWRERREGGGVPASGRRASLADFGTISRGGCGRSGTLPGWLTVGLSVSVIVAGCLPLLPVPLPRGDLPTRLTVAANMAKMTTGAQRAIAAQPL